jgi:ornithine carbamoyltransferase
LSGFPSSASSLSTASSELSRALAQLRQHGAAWRPLEGKILALISASEDTEDAQRFRRAATALGARVAWMRPSFSRDSSPELIRSTSRVLGKLYDAIECQGMDAAVLALIRDTAGIPVFDRLAAEQQPLDPSQGEDKQQLLVQAHLLHAIG